MLREPTLQHKDRPWPSLGGLLLAVLVSLAPPQPAAGKPIAFSAAQLDAFDALKTSAKLPNGETLAYVDTGPRWCWSTDTPTPPATG